MDFFFLISAFDSALCSGPTAVEYKTNKNNERTTIFDERQKIFYTYKCFGKLTKLSNNNRFR